MGDSVQFTANYRVIENVEDIAYQLDVSDNKFFLSNVQNPIHDSNQYQCGSHCDRLNLIGYHYSSNADNIVTINSCDTFEVEAMVGNQLGPRITDGPGGNIFPYEYRHLLKMHDVRIIIPEGFTVENIDLKYEFTTGTRLIDSTEISSIAPDYASNDTLLFNIQQYFISSTLRESDEEMTLNFVLKLTADCRAENAVLTPVIIEPIFDPIQQLTMSNTDSVISLLTAPIIFDGPNLLLQMVQSQVSAVDSVVELDFNISNNGISGSSSNTWITLENLGQSVRIDSVRNILTNTLLGQSGDLYEVGDLPVGTTVNLKAFVTQKLCASDSIEIIAGWNCNTYPTSFYEQCSNESIKVLINPPASKILQTPSIFPTEALSLCELMDFEYLISNVDLGVIKKLELFVNLPVGVELVDSSGYINYPAFGGSLDTIYPTMDLNGQLKFSIYLEDSRLENDGLLSFSNSPLDQVSIGFEAKTSCGFTSGDSITTYVTGEVQCGEVQDTLASSSIVLNLKKSTTRFFRSKPCR